MDKFTPYLLPFRFIDSHFLNFLDSLLVSCSSYDPSFAPLHTLSPFFHDPHLPIHILTSAPPLLFWPWFGFYACSGHGPPMLRYGHISLL